MEINNKMNMDKKVEKTNKTKGSSLKRLRKLLHHSKPKQERKTQMTSIKEKRNLKMW